VSIEGLDEFSPGSTLTFLIIHLFLSSFIIIKFVSFLLLFLYIWLGFRLKCGDLSIPLSHTFNQEQIEVWEMVDLIWFGMWSSHGWWFSWSYFPIFPCHSGLKLDQLWMPWKRTSIYKNIIISTNPIHFISIYHHHLFQPTPYQSIQTPRNNNKERIKERMITNNNNNQYPIPK